MYFCKLKLNNKAYCMKIIKFLPLIAAIALLASCKVPQKVSFFQDLYAGKTLSVSEYQGVRLRPGDHINIVVKSKNEEIAKQLNIGDSFGATGYLLDKNGDVEFLQIGKIHLAGMTREEVQNCLKEEIEKPEEPAKAEKPAPAPKKAPAKKAPAKKAPKKAEK